MLNATFRPIEKWPGKPKPDYARKNDPFSAAYSDTLDLLERELNLLRATNVVIQVALDRKDIRNDGWPKSNARPSSPGVIVTFTKGKETVSMPCDTFRGWEANLRAIALSLEALRKVDRYGVTQNGEQYKGFAALPAPEPPSTMTVDDAARLIEQASGTHSGGVTKSHHGSFQDAYRHAARNLHPDRNGGSHEMFVRLQAAAEVLKQHHGRT